MDTIRHYASFPATGVSLRQMVQFGEKPSIGEHAHNSPFASGLSVLMRLSAFNLADVPSHPLRQAPCFAPLSS
jgi:pyruvate dehydrogenase kinase 2/3/4